jgi:uncharacterized membrane protein (GlpM family)
MQIFVKVICSFAIILAAVLIGKKFPSLAGLIAVMPLAGLVVLVWLYTDTGGNSSVMQEFTRGALWGIIPSILFYLAVFWCFKKEFPLPMALGISFGVWLVAACIHQWLLKGIK